jgi:hypothetical protein
LWRQFDLREPSERAAYWVALKAICADELPKRGYRGRGAVRGGAHASHAMHAEVSGSRDAPPPIAKAALPPHLPARAHAVLSQLKEAQWSTNRPLTSLQKFRLSQANPSALATSSSAELVARADELELHPEQLLHYVQSLPSRVPKHASTAEGGLAQAAPPKRRKSAVSSVSSVSSTTVAPRAASGASVTSELGAWVAEPPTLWYRFPLSA